jgi:hypothetical protein
MPRPRTPIGSYGVIHTEQVVPGVWRARTLFRFPDGKRRQVERTLEGRSPIHAINALKEALVGAETPVDGELKPTTRLSDLLARFLATKQDAGRSARTIYSYQHAVESIIVPRIGDLPIEEATAGRLQAFFSTVAKDRGPGAAKTCRSVLSGAFGMAVRHDVLRANPVAGTPR